MSYILNIDDTYVDNFGNSLLTSNSVLKTCYYDSSAESSWTKNFAGVVDIPTMTSSGSLAGGWSDTSSSSVLGNFSVCANYTLMGRRGDVIKEYTETSSQSSAYDGNHTAEALTKWPSTYVGTDYTIYPWTTTSGNLAWAKYDLGSPRYMSSVYLHWAGCLGNLSSIAEITNYPKYYSISVSNDDFSYDVVVSGTTTTSGEVTPIYQEISPGSYRYVKIDIEDNWGGPQTGFSEFGVYSDTSSPVVIMYPNDFLNTVHTDYAELSRDVDLTGVDRLFASVGGYFNYATGDTYFKILVDSDVVFDSEDPQQPTGSDSFWSERGLFIDTSSYTGIHTIRFRGKGEPYSPESRRIRTYFWVSRVSKVPSWYGEPPSSVRGAKSAFPDKALVVSDSTSLSILDVSSVDGNTGLPESPKLWMRFFYGRDNALQVPPNDIVCGNGKIYLSTYLGLYVIDFVNDVITRRDSDGLYSFSNITDRNYGRDYSTDDTYGATPYWAAISEDAGYKFRDSALESIDIIKDVTSEGDDYIIVGGFSGAESVVSGTVYSSKFRNRISAVNSTDSGEIIFAGGLDGFGRVGVAYDSSCVASDYFDVDYVLHQSNDGVYESFNYGYNEDAITISQGDSLYVSTSGTHATVYGSVEYVGQTDQHAFIMSTKGFADRPLIAEAYVRIRNWPDSSPGEFRFGVFNSEPATSLNSPAEDVRGVYMSARNDIATPGPVYSDSFSDGVPKYYNISPGEDIDVYGNVLCPKYGLGLGVGGQPGNWYSANPHFSNSIYNNSFIARFKLRPYYFYTQTGSADYFSSFYVGLVDKKNYTDEYLVFETTVSDTYRTGVYRVGEYHGGSWAYYPTVVDFFAEDGTEEDSVYRDVELVYDSLSLSLSAYVDGAFVGSGSVPQWTSGELYIYFSAGSYGNENTLDCFVKDFSVDFHDVDYGVDNRKYSVCVKEGASLGSDLEGPVYTEYVWGSADSPYKEKCFTTFSGTEGSQDEPFRKWSIRYNPEHSSFSAYIDDVHIGTTNLEYSDSKLDDLSVGFDVQFWPSVTVSGSPDLEVDIRDFSITCSGTESNHLYNTSSVFFPVPSGNLYDASVVSDITASPTDLHVAAGTGFGAASVCLAKAPEQEYHGFVDGSALPSGWEAKDCPGSVGSSDWTVASGVLKQAGNIYGNGNLGPIDPVFSPFGTHMLSDISCDRNDISDYAVGKTVTARLRTTDSGCVGVGFNEVWETVGTVTSGSGLFCVWYSGGVHVGKFETVYDSFSVEYSPSYSIYGSCNFPSCEAADIGVPRSLSIRFVTDSGVSVVIDGEEVFAFYDTENTEGFCSFISNGNTDLNVFDVRMYDSSVEQSSFTEFSISGVGNGEPVVYGQSSVVSSVFQDGLFTRNSGILHAGTTNYYEYWTRIPKLKELWFTEPQYVNKKYWLSFFYDSSLDKLMGLYTAEDTQYTQVYFLAVQYDFDTNMWRFAGDLAASTLITPESYPAAEVGIPSVYNYSETNAKGHPAIAYCSAVNSAFVFFGDYCVTKYNTASRTVEGWEHSAAPSPSKKLCPKNFGYRADGFFILGHSGGNYCPSWGSPFYNWFDGFVYATYNHTYTSFPTGGDCFWILDPVSGNWSLDLSGAGTVNGKSFHHPPAGEDSAEDEALRYDLNQDFVYCEANDSVYTIRHSGLYRLYFPLLSWYTMSPPPFTVDSTIVSKAVTMEYVSETNEIFCSNGEDGQLYVYQIDTDSWGRSVPVPYGTTSLSHMEWVREKSALFIHVGGEVNEMLSLSFPTTPGVFYDARSSDNGGLPENSRYGMFSWRGPDAYIQDDNFSSINRDMWFTTLSGNYEPSSGSFGGYVAESACVNDSTRISFTTHEPDYYSRMVGVSSRVPILANSFDAEVYIRSTELNVGNFEVYQIFGFGEGSINFGYSQGEVSVPARHHSRGNSGVYACAIDSTTYPSRYSLVKCDGASTTSLVTTDYVLGDATDGSWEAEFRKWGISYNERTSSLVFSLDGVEVGTQTMSSRINEGFIEIGLFGEASPNSYDYPYSTMEIKDFSIDFNGGVQSVATQSGTGYLTINKNKMYNTDYFYERTLTSLVPGRSFVYETEVEIPTSAVTGCPYVLSIGRLRDSAKEINLCALLDSGVKKLGFWTGEDPWDIATGFVESVEYDWSENTTYRISHDEGTGFVSVYVGVNTYPTIVKSYSSFANVFEPHHRSVSFGNIALLSRPTEIIDASFHGGYKSTISGSSWTRLEQNSDSEYFSFQSSSWFGSNVSAAADPGNYDDYVEWVPAVSSGTCHLYCSWRNSDLFTHFATDSPYTVYHSGVVDLPVADGYATNAITAVYDNTTHSGTTCSGATTIDIDANRLANGNNEPRFVFPGLLYLGAYTDISSVVATRDADASYVDPGTLFFYRADRAARLGSTFTSVWKYVKCEPGVTEFSTRAIQKTSGVTIIDTAYNSRLDYFSSSSDPAIGGDDISGVTGLR